MKPATNVFGQRICALKDCPVWFESEEHPEYGSFCEAHMDYPGTVGVIGGKRQYGVLCKLPIGFKVVRVEE